MHIFHSFCNVSTQTLQEQSEKSTLHTKEDSVKLRAGKCIPKFYISRKHLQGLILQFLLTKAGLNATKLVFL